MPKASKQSRAPFITFEGGEGVGKSTQIKRLQQKLQDRSIEVVRTREPGGTPKAEAIRAFILQGRSEKWGPGAEAVLFAAARYDHVTQLIAPNLRNGTWVLSDRFHDSTRAYQGAAGGADPALIKCLEDHVVGALTPDLTLILDVPVAEGLARAGGRGEGEDRFESKGLAFHEQLRQAFLEIALREPQRCAIIDVTDAVDVVTANILDIVERRLAP